MNFIIRLFESVLLVFENRDFKSLNIVTTTLGILLISNLYAISHVGLSYFHIGLIIFDLTIFVPTILIGMFSFWALQKYFDGVLGFIYCSALTLLIFYVTALMIHGVYIAISGMIGL